MSNTCKECGGAFESPITNKEFCSVKCRRAFWRKRAKEDRAAAIVTPKCAMCGKEFVPKTKNDCYCSDECKTIAKQKKHNILECPWCKRKFYPTSATQIYCSKHCGTSYRNSHMEAIENEAGKLSRMGKVLANRWIRLELCDGFKATNKKPYSVKLCANLLHVPTKEIENALQEYDEAVKNGTEMEFVSV